MRHPRVVDGGLATGLEELGYELDTELWSAGLFLRQPEAVERLHRTYLEAGAEILITASYQMSFEGLARAGLDRAAAADAMRRTVEVAARARQAHGKAATVAASVGPYGASLADGSEYRGDYGLSVEQLKSFHRPRLEILGESGADLLAVETLPSFDEAVALFELLGERSYPPAWVSFSCRDGSRISDGRPIAEVAEMLDRSERVFAVGVNCTAPEHVSSLMAEIRRVSRKPIVVYPNSGESWDAHRRCWSGSVATERFIELAGEWQRSGAWAVGGCCRVGPGIIRKISELFSH